MRVELANGWIELDGEVVTDTSFCSADVAETYVTHAVREQAIEESMLDFVSKLARRMSASNHWEANDLNNSIWTALLKLRDDEERWNVRYLKGKAIYIAMAIIKTGSYDIIPFTGEPVAPFVPDYSDLYSLISKVKNARQREVLELTAAGLAPNAIGTEMGLDPAQVRSALSKGYTTMRAMVCNMSEERKEELRLDCGTNR